MIATRRAALAVLVLVNTLNFFDRQVLGAVVEPLRREWGLSDGEIGWIGTAFTLLYAIVGMPLGRLADTRARTRLLAAGVFFWSALTGLSSLAIGFRTLFLARLGVGVGEAVCAPAATSLIGDLFPAERRARATAVFMLGLPLGLGLSYAVSGAVAAAYGWRAAFLVAGIPGLFVAILCLGLREPERGAAEEQAVGAQQREGSAWRLLLGTPTLVWIIVSGALHNFNLYALSTFLPAFLTRRHGLGVREAGAASGLIFGVVGGLGMMVGGIAADRLAAKRADGRMWLSTAALAFSVPVMILMLRQPPGHATEVVGLLALAILSMYFYYAPVYATVHDIVEPALRGRAMAIYFLAMYFLGASLGPVGTGLLSDRLALRAAAAAGSSVLTEAFRADGLHQAMYVIPIFGLILTAVLAAGARTVGRDRERLREWMASVANR